MVESFDRWMERAVLRRLEPREQQFLSLALGCGTSLGILLSWLWPSASGVCLLFPLMAVCFFRGSRASILLPPMVVYQWWLTQEFVPNLLFVAAGLTGVAFATITTRKYRQARRHELRLDQELILAREVQQSMHPRSLFQHGPLQLATHMKASHSLGGDFLCVSHPGPQRFGVMLGDVMGKGTQAALTAALMDGLYTELAETGASPGPLLSQLNRRLISRFGGAERMATLVCLELDLEQGCWVFSRAGHPPPLLTRRDGSRLMLDTPGLIAGISSDHYEECSIPLQAGDQILLVSDGLVECDLQECEHLSGLLAARLEEPLEQALKAIVNELQISLPNAVDDDETAALLRFNIRTDIDHTSS